ncbi:MAG: 50S ribosomal protein L3 [Desulfococcaceae bacterium]|nr:50S ribosomal protein L3 [Desulfococcaceae bacterium]
MCKGLIGKKIGMTAVFSSDRKRIPVTALQVGPCVVTQIKTQATDGYNALQLGFGTRKEKRISRPLKNHLKKSGTKTCAALREFAVSDPRAYSLGQIIGTELFTVGEKIRVTGKTKGRGFAGVVKRHGFGGGRKTHGGKCYRIPGSIGCSAWPSKVMKGKKMPGHYGNEKKTVTNLEIVDIRPEENIILIKGAVPGHRSALLKIEKSGSHK